MQNTLSDQTFKPLRQLLFFVALAVFAMIPFAVSLPGISRLQLREVMIPMLFGLSLIDATVNTKNFGLYTPKRGSLHLLFVALFMFAVLISFVRNPVSPIDGSASEGGFKLYWKYFCAFLTYLTAIYWINRYRVPPMQVMRVLFYLVSVVTVLGIIMVLTGIKLPGLDVHAWSVSSTAGYGEAAGSLRAPFLEVFAQLGFFLSLTRIVPNEKLRWPLLLYFMFCIFLGGGRVTLISSFAGVIVWLFLNRRFLLTGAVVGSFLFALLSIQFIHEIAPTPQLKRLTRLGSLEESSIGRHYMFQYLVDHFLANPVAGTGFGKTYDIGLIRMDSKFEDSDRINKQLSMGTHTTHLQILKNLGLVGYIPFMLIWIYPLIKLLPYAMDRSRKTPKEVEWSSQFSIVLISAMLIRMIVAGNGSEPRIYIYAAVIGCILAQALAFPGRSSTSTRNLLHRSYPSRSTT